MDLDVLRKYGLEKIIIADEYEFEQHKIEYNYPKNLIHSCEEEVNVVKKLMQQRKEVFSDKAFNWRPGKALPFITD